MKNKQYRELAVCGFEAVSALAAKHPEKINRLFFTHERARFFGSVCKELAAARKVYRAVESENELERLCGSVHHQGVVAMIPEPNIPFLNESVVDTFYDKKGIILLDRVGNANNLGAIVRSAAFFGIDTVILTDEDDQARISTSMYRVAQGGMEFVDLWKVPHSASFLEQLPETIVSIGADHRSNTDITALSQLVPSRSVPLVVLGNEETGLSPETKKQCRYLVRISGCGAIESLNVAQAATLFLHAVSINRTKV